MIRSQLIPHELLMQKPRLIVVNALPLSTVSKSSYFLGDPPPDPRFLASLGALSLAELDHYSSTEAIVHSCLG
jgi:hypothetical protein